MEKTQQVLELGLDRGSAESRVVGGGELRGVSGVWDGFRLGGGGCNQ